MQGYPDGDFGPTRNMTRAEAVVMFSRLITNVIDDKGDYENTYSDVPLGQWYSNAIGYMEQHGVLSSDIANFRPNDKITRAEFADLACSFENLTSGAANNFTDVPSSNPYYNEINYAVARGWLTGYPDGSFRPNNPIQRSEVVTVTNRVLERYADHNYIYNNASSITHYNDITSGYWAFYDIMEASNGHEYTKDGATETWLSLQ